MPISPKRLAEIAAIRDEDIDTSDIPEASAEWFARARWSFPMMPWNGRCHGCDGALFLAGPRGGMAQNVMCANMNCRRKYNVARWRGELLMIHALPTPSRDEYFDWWTKHDYPFLDTPVLRAEWRNLLDDE